MQAVNHVIFWSLKSFGIRAGIDSRVDGQNRLKFSLWHFRGRQGLCLTFHVKTTHLEQIICQCETHNRKSKCNNIKQMMAEKLINNSYSSPWHHYNYYHIIVPLSLEHSTADNFEHCWKLSDDYWNSA